MNSILIGLLIFIVSFAVGGGVCYLYLRKKLHIQQEYNEYVAERGELMWDLNQLPFPYGKNEQELFEKIKVFDEKKYQRELTQLFIDTELLEDGKAGKRMVEEIRKHI